MTSDSSIEIYVDSETKELQLKMKSLEALVSIRQAEKIDLEKAVAVFNIRNNLELGHLIREILLLQKNQAEKAYREQPSKETKHTKDEADKEFSSFEQDHQFFNNHKIHTLTEDEMSLLKERFRKASKLCHPDMVSEKHKENAAKIFGQLKEAYDTNNLQAVTDILNNLENGEPFLDEKLKATEKTWIIDRIQHLQLVLFELENEIRAIRNSEAFRITRTVGNLDVYFKDRREELIKKIDDLKKAHS